MSARPTQFRILLAAIAVTVLGSVHALLGGTPGIAGSIAARLVERMGKSPYDRYETEDALGRTVTFYVAEAPKGDPTKGQGAPAGVSSADPQAQGPSGMEPSAEPGASARSREGGGGSAGVPLVVHIQGSGADSHFVKVGEKVGTTSGFPHIHDALQGRGRVLVVEKPGVNPFDQGPTPGAAEGASEVFRREHTLDRWAGAVVASIRAALELPGVDGSRLLVMGHSEGGLVACRVAAIEPRVTHVGVLAGGGPTQLYDFVAMARRGGGMFDRVSPDPEQRVAWLRRAWGGVLADPDSPDAMFLGHPHRRWSTFGATSPMEELARAPARVKVYIAQGSEDTSVWPETALMLEASLRAKGRDVTLNWVEGGDHGFVTRPERPGTGMKGVFADTVEWFLKG